MERDAAVIWGVIERGASPTPAAQGSLMDYSCPRGPAGTRVAPLTAPPGLRGISSGIRVRSAGASLKPPSAHVRRVEAQLRALAGLPRASRIGWAECVTEGAGVHRRVWI